MTTPHSMPASARVDTELGSIPRFGDYRDSHQNKGDDYHRLFSDNPYARLLWILERRVLDRVARGLPRSGSLRHLDFACGTGRIIAHLEQYCGESLGVDVSLSMLRVARRTAPGASFLCADITSTPLLQDQRFDLVTTFRFFLNAEPPLRLAAMKKLASLLTTDGVLVFNNHRQHRSLTHRLLLRMKPGRRDLHYMPHSEVLDLVTAAGLRIVRTFPLGILPATEGRMLLPTAVMFPIERIALTMPSLRSFANDVVYVCARA